MLNIYYKRISNNVNSNIVNKMLCKYMYTIHFKDNFLKNLTHALSLSLSLGHASQAWLVTDFARPSIVCSFYKLCCGLCSVPLF